MEAMQAMADDVKTQAGLSFRDDKYTSALTGFTLPMHSFAGVQRLW